eukprot:3879210-Rhodomonas_salina.1
MIPANHDTRVPGGTRRVYPEERGKRGRGRRVETWKEEERSSDEEKRKCEKTQRGHREEKGGVAMLPPRDSKFSQHANGHACPTKKVRRARYLHLAVMSITTLAVVALSGYLLHLQADGARSGKRFRRSSRSKHRVIHSAGDIAAEQVRYRRGQEASSKRRSNFE